MRKGIHVVSNYGMTYDTKKKQQKYLKRQFIDLKINRSSTYTYTGMINFLQLTNRWTGFSYSISVTVVHFEIKDIVKSKT